MEILTLVLGGVVAFGVWLAQLERTKRRLRIVLFNDIRQWRQTLLIMANFFTNLQIAIERGEAKRFDFRRSDFSLYHHMLPQIHLFSDREIVAITSFYEYYKTMEGDIVGTMDTLRQWDELLNRGQEIDDKRRAIALDGLERIIKVRQLLLKNTEGKKIRDFGDSYHQSLQNHIETYRNKIKEESGIEFL